MKKLDPALEVMLHKRKISKQESLISRDIISESNPIHLDIILKYKNDLSPLIDLGLKVNATFGNIITGSIALDDVETLFAHPNVIKIESSREMFKELDNSIINVRANTVRTLTADKLNWTSDSITGRGVVVGIIDSGIDIEHGCFRKMDDSKETRILYLWDQSLTPQNGETSPVNLPADLTLNYGVEYDKDWIDEYLESNPTNPDAPPARQVRHNPIEEDNHGSHVSGIAVGNGSQSNPNVCCEDAFQYVGVAPEADIIFVKNSELLPSTNLGYSTRLLEAIKYIHHRAQQLSKPCVINISLGDNNGPHDGTSLTELAIDNLLTTASRLVVVKSAGNEGNSTSDTLSNEADRHASGSINGGETIQLKVKVRANNIRVREVFIWYPGAHSLKCSITPNGEAQSSTVSPGDAILSFNTVNNSNVSINSKTNDPDNGDKEIYVALNNPSGGHLPSGDWIIHLENTGASAVDFHAWIQRGDYGPKFLPPYVNDSCTISIPGTAEKIISVGNYITKGQNIGDLSRSSSRGPVRPRTSPARTSPIVKPEIAAPGTTIKSVSLDTRTGCIQELCVCCHDQYIEMQGTSMSSPHVAGTVALMYQVKSDLTLDQIRTILTTPANLQSDPTRTGAVPNPNWGFGKIDVRKILEAVATLAGTTLPTLAAPIVTPFLAPPPPNLPPQYLTLQPLQERFLMLPKGQHLRRIGIELFEEIRILVNTNKRVATVWHRCAGPVWLRNGLRIADAPYEIIPEQVNGVKLQEAINRMTSILKKYGSPLLIQNLQEWQNELQILRGGMSIFQLYEEYEMVIE